MGKINFEIFEDNSSTRDALIDFANGFLDSVQFEEGCWPQHAKRQVRLMRKVGVKKSRRLARKWLKKEGYGSDLYERCPTCGRVGR